MSADLISQTHTLVQELPNPCTITLVGAEMLKALPAQSYTADIFWKATSMRGVSTRLPRRPLYRRNLVLISSGALGSISMQLGPDSWKQPTSAQQILASALFCLQKRDLGKSQNQHYRSVQYYIFQVIGQVSKCLSPYKINKTEYKTNRHGK